MRNIFRLHTSIFPFFIPILFSFFFIPILCLIIVRPNRSIFVLSLFQFFAYEEPFLFYFVPIRNIFFLCFLFQFYAYHKHFSGCYSHFVTMRSTFRVLFQFRVYQKHISILVQFFVPIRRIFSSFYSNLVPMRSIFQFLFQFWA